MMGTYRNFLSRARLPGLVLGSALLMTGCPNPNTYGTPRTTPKGKISHSVAAEWLGVTFEERISEQAGATDDTTSVSTSVVAPPTYTIRLGVADNMDVGLRAANMSALGFDFKYNFLRSESFDLAIDPGVQWLNVGFNVFHVHVPVLLGINLSPHMSIVATPGIMYGITSVSSGDEEFDNELDQFLSTDGIYGRLGVGIDFRFSRKFAIHPEITFLRGFEKDDTSVVQSAMTYMFGIGFNFGNLPDFGIDGGEAE